MFFYSFYPLESADKIVDEVDEKPKKTAKSKAAELEESGRKRQNCSDTKYISIPERLLEYPNQTLHDRDGELFCDACAKVISMKKSTVKNHVEGVSHTKNLLIIRQRD